MRLGAFFIVILVFLGISANSFAETTDPDCLPPTHLLKFYDENGSVLGVINLDDYFSSNSYWWLLNDTKIAKLSYMVLGSEDGATTYSINVEKEDTSLSLELSAYPVSYAPCEGNTATYYYVTWNLSFDDTLNSIDGYYFQDKSPAGNTTLVLPKMRNIYVHATNGTENIYINEEWGLLDIDYSPFNLSAVRIEEGDDGYFAELLFNVSINLNYAFNRASSLTSAIEMVLPYFDNTADTDERVVCNGFLNGDASCEYNNTYELDLSLNNDVIESNGYFDKFLRYLLSIKMLADYGKVEIPLYYYIDYAPPEVSVKAVSHDNASQALDTTYFYVESCYSDVYICEAYVDGVLKMIASNCTNLSLTNLLPTPHSIKVVWKDAAGNAYEEMFFINTSYAFPYCDQHKCYYDGQEVGSVSFAAYPYSNISIDQILKLVRNISLIQRFNGIYLDSSWKDYQPTSLQNCDVLKLDSGFLVNCTSVQENVFIDVSDGNVKGAYYGNTYYRQDTSKTSTFNDVAYVLSIRQVLINRSLFTTYFNVSYDFCNDVFYDTSRLNKVEGCKGYVATLNADLNLTAHLELNDSLVAVPLYDYYLPYGINVLDLSEAIPAYHNFTLRNYDGFAYESVKLNAIPESQLLDESKCEQINLYYDMDAYETKIVAVPYECDIIEEQHEYVVVSSNATDKHVRITYTFSVPTFIADAFNGNYTYKVELPSNAYYVYVSYGNDLDLTNLISYSKEGNIIILSLDASDFKQNSFNFVVDYWYTYQTSLPSSSSHQTQTSIPPYKTAYKTNKNTNNTEKIYKVSHKKSDTSLKLNNRSSNVKNITSSAPANNTTALESLSKQTTEQAIKQGWFSAFTGRYFQQVVSNSYLKIILVLIILMAGVILYKRANKNKTRSSQTPRLAYLKKLKEVV